MDEFSSTDAKRQIPIGMIPMESIKVEVAEMKRMAKKGIRGGLIPPDLGQGRFWNDPQFEPIWKTAAEPTFQDDRAGIATRHLIGIDALCWHRLSHPETTWPHTKQNLSKQFEGVPEADVRKLICENAARLYDLPV
jgi:hypothetical protein